MGPPGLDGNEANHVVFAGYTPDSFSGNLDGRSGAHAQCSAAYPGSHFCTDWELDQSRPPPIASSAWVDVGDDKATSRWFRARYSTNDIYTCGGWTSGSANAKPDGVNTGRGQIYTALGGFSSSWVAVNDGGCQNARPLACCLGGTKVRFRGYTAPVTGNLGGRSGANATCHAAFSGSHLCTDWEVDQAAVRAPIPSTGAWVDIGDGRPSSRLYHARYSTSDIYTCGGWTSGAAAAKPDGVNTGRGTVLTPLGGIGSSWVAVNDGGCQNARPLACCDGTPPQ